MFGWLSGGACGAMFTTLDRASWWRARACRRQWLRAASESWTNTIRWMGALRRAKAAMQRRATHGAEGTDWPSQTVSALTLLSRPLVGWSCWNLRCEA